MNWFKRRRKKRRAVKHMGQFSEILHTVMTVLDRDPLLFGCDMDDYTAEQKARFRGAQVVENDDETKAAELKYLLGLERAVLYGDGIDMGLTYHGAASDMRRDDWCAEWPKIMDAIDTALKAKPGA